MPKALCYQRCAVPYYAIRGCWHFLSFADFRHREDMLARCALRGAIQHTALRMLLMRCFRHCRCAAVFAFTAYEDDAAFRHAFFPPRFDFLLRQICRFSSFISFSRLPDAARRGDMLRRRARRGTGQDGATRCSFRHNIMMMMMMPLSLYAPAASATLLAAAAIAADDAALSRHTRAFEFRATRFRAAKMPRVMPQEYAYKAPPLQRDCWLSPPDVVAARGA